MYPTSDISSVVLKSVNKKNDSPVKVAAPLINNIPLKEAVNEKDSKTSYDKISENTKNDVETFLIRDLNFNLNETSEIFNIIKKSDKEFSAQVEKKRKKLEGLYKESYGYMYDPEDYILMGKKRLEARALIKKLVGEEKYNKFVIYIRDYNHGRYAESFVPIDF
jgi:hypothetical protein